MKRPLFGGALSIAATAMGCAQAPPPSQFPSADALVGRMRAGFECAVGVQGTAKVDLVSKQGRVKGEVDLFAMNPDKIRFDVASPFGVMIYSLTSDGRDYKFSDLEKKTFFYGPADTCNLARFTQVPVPPSALVSMLRGEAPLLVHESRDAALRWDGDGYYEIEVRSKHEAVQRLRFEVTPSDFERPWNEQRVRLVGVDVEQGGAPLYSAELGDFVEVETAKARIDEDGLDDPIEPSGPSCNAEMPRSIRFKVEETSDDVLFSYKEAKWNPPLLPGTFTQPVPGGMRKQYTSCEGTIAPAGAATP